MITRKLFSIFLCLCFLNQPCYAIETTWQEDRAAGSKAFDAGNYKDAVVHFESALKKVEATSTSSEIDVGSCCNWLANAYQSQARYTHAELLYQRALAICEKALGPHNPHAATCLDSLANLYCEQGRYPELEPMYKRALAIREKTFGPDHAIVATSLNNLAIYYCFQRRYPEAETLHKRALAIREKTLGPDHTDVATSLNNLAGLYCDLGRYPEAESLDKRALAIREKALNPDHPDVASSLSNLAFIYQSQWRYPEAEPMYKRALAIREKALNPKHPDVADSLNKLAGLYSNLGRYTEAEPMYKRALAIREDALNPNHPGVADSLGNLAGLYCHLGRYTEAEPLDKRALAIREKGFTPSNPDVAISLNDLAFLYCCLGRYTEAEPLAKRALAIREKARNPDHPDVATSLNNLASIYQSLERYSEAESLYKRALAIYEKTNGVRIEINQFARAAQQQRFNALNTLKLITRCDTLTRGSSIWTESDNPKYKYSSENGDLLEVEVLEKLQANPRAAVMSQFKEVLEIRRKNLGDNEYKLAEVLMQIGIAFDTMGGSSKELCNIAFEPLSAFGRVLVAETADAGTKAPDVYSPCLDNKTVQHLGGIEEARAFAAATLLCLGNALAGNGEDKKAKDSFSLAEKCFLAQSDQAEDSRVDNLISLSEAWLNFGEFAKSQALLSKAIGFANKPHNKFKCMVADARLKMEQADYSSALDKGERSLEVGKEAVSAGELKSGGESLFDCYKVLAESSFAMGNLDKAKENANNLLNLNGLSKSEQAYGQVLLASIQFELKQYEDARKSLEAALALNDRNDKTLEQSTFTQAATFLGLTLERLGELKGDNGARRQFGWALSWDQTNPSFDGLLATARDYNGLALVETALVAARDKDGDADRAKYYALEGSQKIDKYIKTAFPGLSIGQLCAFVAIPKQQRDALLTVCQSKESIGPAYGLMMRWKGLLLEGLRYKGAIKVAVQNNPALKDKQEQLEGKIRLLAALGNKGDDTTSGDEAKNRYHAETAEREKLEQEISDASGVKLKDPLSAMGADAFRNLLKSDEAFVDIASYKPLTKDNERYAAIAMKAGADGEPQFFDLGGKEEIDQIIRRWRFGVTGSESERPGRELDDPPDQELQESLTDKEFAELSDKLSNLLLTNSKLQSYLGSNVKQIWLCPEEEFSRIPWNAIAAINGSATFQVISEVDSPREFVFMRGDQSSAADTNTSQKILLAGLKDFRKAGLRDIAGAIEEVSQIKELADSLHRPVEYLAELDATKNSVKAKLTEVTVAHVATHGFAAKSNAGSKDGRGSRAVRFTMRTGGGITLPTARNPLSECGIYLAYPSDGSITKELAPNILTADEIIGLNLSKCEIVTLSACQTGLGRTLVGQGVVGLRSAIIGAGAKSVLMSLWSVPDEATRELMKRFYSNLWEKNLPKHEALADAQNFIRSKRKWQKPEFWAAWVLVGE